VSFAVPLWRSRLISVGVIVRFRVLMARVYAMLWAFGVFVVFLHCSSVLR